MDNLKEKAQLIKEAIDKSDNILLHLHPGPDMDSFGSASAFYLYLKSLNKNPTLIAGDSKLPEKFSSFSVYEEVADQNFLEIDQSKFDLFISLDAGGLSQISKSGEVEFNKGLRVINIDHHISNQNYGDINWVEPQSSSTAEMIFHLFKQLDVELDHQMALCLLLGIWTDTGGFQYSSTGLSTFKAATELVNIADDYHKYLNILLASNHPDWIKFQAMAFNSIENPAKQIALVSVTLDDLNEKGIEKENIKQNNIPSFLISVKDWFIGVSVVEKEKDKNFISFRSKSDDIDVAQIAERLGGGGHKKAAGAFLLGSNQEAKEAVVQAIFETHPKLSY